MGGQVQTAASRWERPYAAQACCYTEEIDEALGKLFRDGGARRAVIVFFAPDAKARVGAQPLLNELFSGMIIEREPFGSSQSKVHASYYAKTSPNSSTLQRVATVLVNEATPDKQIQFLKGFVDRVAQGDIFGLAQLYGKDVIDPTLSGRTRGDRDTEATLPTVRAFLDYARSAYDRAENRPDLPALPVTVVSRAWRR